MLSNVGNTIQKMINNTPTAITNNDNTTVVVTNGGNVYQAGFIGNRIQYSFREIVSSDSLGKILDAEAVEDRIYLLSVTGSVYEYDYTPDFGPAIREIYNPGSNKGDKAVKIVTGRKHVLILTEAGRVWGAGDNSNYQLVPQGQCRYDTAVEVIVTDTVLHDNNSQTAFTGIYNELEYPVIPTNSKNCGNLNCIKDTLCGVSLGSLNIGGVNTSCSSCPGTLAVPIFGDITYVGFLCVDSTGCVSGWINYQISRLYIKCGSGIAKLIYGQPQGCQIREINIASTTQIIFFDANPCQVCSPPPIMGSVPINGRCGGCITVPLNCHNIFPPPEVIFSQECHAIIIKFGGCQTNISILCDGCFTGISPINVGPVVPVGPTGPAGSAGSAGPTGPTNIEAVNVGYLLELDVPIDCCQPAGIPDITLPQPIWNNIFAGGDLSVLVDSYNRLYVFGSLYQVRNNRDLIKRTCLEDLINKTNVSISFPADQLNCTNLNTCKCPRCRSRPFRTDLNKFGIHLNFPPKQGCGESFSVCDFLKALKECNQSISDQPVCEPCDAYIYLNVVGQYGCNCNAQPAPHIGSITIFNKKSICKLVSQKIPDTVNVTVNLGSVIEYDLNKIRVDNLDLPLEKIVKLNFCVKGPNVNIYINVDNPGGIKFTDGGKYNVEFTVNASTQTHQFILNYGGILDPVELTNLKYALSLDCIYPCPKFKNPFDTKITFTYLKGGDHVKFVVTNPNTIRQAITADIPTVFRLNRRVITVGVGNNNLSVLVGGLACPNEVYAIGRNCNGELGIGSVETPVIWTQVNRQLFDCQVVAIFSGDHVTFYITQSQKVYASGQWKCYVNSRSPELAKGICQNWRIRYISVGKNDVILLGADGAIFGLGDNSFGELGLCNLSQITKPTPLSFFYKLNSCTARQLCDNLAHPVERKFRQPFGAPCGIPDGAPCGAPGVPCGDGPADGRFPRKYIPNFRCYPKRK